jgi:hypothetical protein
MQIKATVAETIVLEKEVIIEVPEGTHEEAIYNLVTEEAYSKTIMQHTHEHGWVGKKTVGVEVKYDK